MSLSSNITYHQRQAASAATATNPFPSKHAWSASHSSKATVLSSNRSATACPSVMNTCILATQFPLSHATISSAFAILYPDLWDDLSSALSPGDNTMGAGLELGLLMKSKTSWCSRAIRVWAFHTLQFEPLSLRHSMLSRSFASSQSVFEGMSILCCLWVLAFFVNLLVSWAHNLLKRAASNGSVSHKEN